MTYIVLDLEWSQPVCREKMRIAGTRVLQVEIIQIGAVAVTDGIVSEDFFSEYVRPRYYTELKGRIKKLTGITKNDLKNAHDLTVVLKSFREWLEKFGKDVIIVTWGPDDIPTLVKQCEFYERDTGWLPEWFNLQPLMTRQYGIDRAQITLQSAVEITGVQQELDYHSAINDAYYTALVLTKINDIPSEIELQKKIDYVHSNPFLSLRQTSEGTVKTARMNAVPRLSELNRYICPVCGKPATLKSRLIWLSPMNYMAVVHCNKHSVKVTVRFEKKADGEYRWVKKYTLSEEKDEELYSSLLKEKYPALPVYPVDDDHVKLAAGWLIEAAGWKGKVVGHAGVHEKQALVLVNMGGATGIEIAHLANEIKKSVFLQFGVWLEPEVNVI